MSGKHRGTPGSHQPQLGFRASEARRRIAAVDISLADVPSERGGGISY